jgi:hypothetical protein
MRFITLVAAEDYECDGCGWEIQKTESFVAVWHGDGEDHYECICLHCDEIRKDQLAVEGEVVDDRTQDTGADPVASGQPH